ncbi:hypothetical protein MBRA1_000855 [Malassezia brasiliensis]|uniref:DUF803-domain-containing protein n=1 Tax=Malassezia brasiliensis TaxID=1821822 RepID=A0AAF0DUJ4_9BASI|nr:hypothetical protein MBRA1_000855 [Malassezia brasiliensis]
MGPPSWWTGVCVTIASNVLISLALNCQKLAHMRLDAQAQGDTPPTEETRLLTSPPPPPSYLRSKLWWTGLALMGLGESGNFLSYGLAPASLVAPLGAVSLLSNVIIAPAMLHETIHAFDLIGILLAISGAVAVVSSAGPSGSEPLDPQHLWVALSRTTFVVYTGAMLVLAATLMVLCNTPVGKRSVLAHVGTCAVFGAFTVLATKGISSFLVLDTDDGPAWMLHEPLFYVLAAVLASTAVAQLAYLNRALQSFDSRKVVPTQFVLFTMSTIVGSSILYRDFARVSWGQITGFTVGVLVTFLGVIVLTYSPSSQSEEEEAPAGAETSGPMEIVIDPASDTPGGLPVEIVSPKDPANAATLSPKMGTRRRAYTSPGPEQGRTLLRPRQRLADMAASLVEQSQSFLSSDQPIPRRMSSRPPRPHTSSSLTGSMDEDGHLRAPLGHAFLGISPGRNLLLIPNQGTPSLLPLDLPRHRSGHTRRGSALASLFHPNAQE